MWSAPVVRDLKIDHTQPEARNSAVVGIGTHTHTLTLFRTTLGVKEVLQS